MIPFTARLTRSDPPPVSIFAHGCCASPAALEVAVASRSAPLTIVPTHDVALVELVLAAPVAIGSLTMKRTVAPFGPTGTEATT